jgi:hypothetical protein
MLSDTCGSHGVTMKISVSWDVIQCSLRKKVPSFGGTRCLHLEGRGIVTCGQIYVVKLIGTLLQLFVANAPKIRVRTRSAVCVSTVSLTLMKRTRNTVKWWNFGTSHGHLAISLAGIPTFIHPKYVIPSAVR